MANVLPMTDDYIYEPLPDANHIRLLTVKPAESLDADIECEIGTVSRQESRDLKYTALSYCWATQDGDASFCCKVSIGGKTKAITRNLFDALRYLRLPGDDLRMWIDAVCINQNDANEKTQQVAAMAAIYANAGRVIAWLGIGQPTQDELAYLFLSLLVHIDWDSSGLAQLGTRTGHLGDLECCTEENSTIWRIRKERTDAFVEHRLALYPLEYKTRNMAHLRWTAEDTMDVIEPFLSRRYFSRRWIVQELVLANPGSVFLQWSHHIFGPGNIFSVVFRKLLDMIYNLNVVTRGLSVNSRVKPLCTQIGAISLLWSVGDRRIHRDLPSTLWRCDRLDCFDPRDRLYSLVSIDPDCNILPDYNLQLDAVFIEFAKYLWSTGRTEDICENLKVARPESPKLDLPSWVPDLRFPFVSYDEYSGISTTHFSPTFSQDRVLTCRLRYLCTVCSEPTLSESASPHTPPRAFFKVRCAWNPSVSQGRMEVKSDEEVVRRGDMFYVPTYAPDGFRFLFVLRPTSDMENDLFVLVRTFAMRSFWGGGTDSLNIAGDTLATDSLVPVWEKGIDQTGIAGDGVATVCPLSDVPKKHSLPSEVTIRII